MADESSTSTDDAAAAVVRLVEEAKELWQENRLADSKPLLERARELAEKSLGREHTHLAWVLSHLGWLARRREQHQEAVVAYRTALAIWRSQCGATHSRTLLAANELVAALHAAGRYEEAEHIGVTVIADFDRESKEEDAALVNLLNTVAWSSYFVGRYADAEPLYLRALSIEDRLAANGVTASPETASGLAYVYDRGKIPGDAGKYYRLALAREEAAGGSDTPAAIERTYRRLSSGSLSSIPGSQCSSASLD